MRIKILMVCLFIGSICLGQSNDEYESIEKTLQGYYESFYEGNVSSFTKSISKEVKKYGYWKNDEGKYDGEPLSYEDMLKYVKRIESEGNDRDVSIKEIKIFDVLNNTASARLKFWWGYDYMLLAKEAGQWKIRMVLWEGPLK